jgi:segregation and condensation protein B
MSDQPTEPTEPSESSESSELSPTESIDLDERVAEYKRAIESIVLVAHDPVPAELLAQLLEEPTVMIEQWCEELAESYITAGHGFVLVNIAGGWRLQTADDLTPYVERFLLHDQRARLSGAALETLAIVAYKQPISRGQVASIRGVDPDGVLRTLQARGYIDEVGRDNGPGQAILYGTTATFLEKLGLASLDDLPPIAEFIPSADVVEALEIGLRVTPLIEVSTTAAPDTAAPEAVASDGVVPEAVASDAVAPDATSP